MVSHDFSGKLQRLEHELPASIRKEIPVEIKMKFRNDLTGMDKPVTKLQVFAMVHQLSGFCAKVRQVLNIGIDCHSTP